MMGRKEKATRRFKKWAIVGYQFVRFLGCRIFWAKQKGSQWIPARFNSRSLTLYLVVEPTYLKNMSQIGLFPQGSG